MNKKYLIRENCSKHFPRNSNLTRNMWKSPTFQSGIVDDNQRTFPRHDHTNLPPNRPRERKVDREWGQVNEEDIAWKQQNL
jgi:hypothetical protein